MSYIHIYQGSVVAGNTSGTQVSEGDSISPITCTLNATNNQVSDPIKLAIRCDGANPPDAPNGYTTTTNTIITPTGTTYDKWALALDNSGSAGTFEAYGDPLTITDIIGTTNTIFWVKAKSISSETPINDVSTDLVVTTTIGVI